MPAPPPADGDQPATRRDLAQLREVLLAMMRAQGAELRQEMAHLRAEFLDRLHKTDGRIDQLHAEMIERFRRQEEHFASQTRSQTRWLIGAMSFWGALLATLAHLA